MSNLRPCFSNNQVNPIGELDLFLGRHGDVRISMLISCLSMPATYVRLLDAIRHEGRECVYSAARREERETCFQSRFNACIYI